MTTPSPRVADGGRRWRGPLLPVPTRQGWVTALGGLVWLTVAWLTGQRDLIWPGLFVLSLPVASWLLLAIGARPPEARRTVTPSEVRVGERLTSRIEVTAGLDAGAVVSYSDERSPALLGATQARFPLGSGRHRIEHQLTAGWRGRHRLGPLRRKVTDALGLARAQQVLPGTVEVLALPVLHPLDSLQAASGMGAATDQTVLKTSLVGSDDVLVREYLPGDDVRRIHWRSTARTGELMVRREERAWDPSAALLIDNREEAFPAPEDLATGELPAGAEPASDWPEPRFEWLVSAAASIAAHLVDHGFAVALSDTDATTADRAERHSQGVIALSRRLAELELTASGSLDRAVAASPTGARGQLLIALLGRLDGGDAGVLAEARRDHQACWALLREPAVVDPEALRLLEVSGWRVLRVSPDTPVATAWRLLGEVAR